MRQILLAVLLLSAAFAKDKPEKVYPEHGTVVAMRMERVSRGGGVYTDSHGKTHGGVVNSRKYSVFKIRTPDVDYELEGGKLSIGDQVNFRIEKHNAYIQIDHKEKKFSLVGQELRSSPPN